MAYSPVNKESEITELPASLGIKNLKGTMDRIGNAFGLIDGEMEGRALDAEAEMRSYSSWAGGSSGGKFTF